MPELLHNQNSTLCSLCPYIASYLSLEDIQALKKTCKSLNKQFTDLDVAWQPFLNRLHEIDETISINPSQGQKIKDAFIVGLEKIKKRQLEEIEYLRKKHTDKVFSNYPNIIAEKSNQTLKLKDIIAISTELDAINFEIIKPIIIEAKIGFSSKLNLNDKGLTRFPEKLIKNASFEYFWRYLKTLSLNNNYLQTIPESIGNTLKSLKLLDITENQLSFLPESIAMLTSLQKLCLAYNQLTKLPESIDNLQNLYSLDLRYNRLTTLPEAIGNIQRLQILHCENNQLMALPVSIQNLRLAKKWPVKTLANQCHSIFNQSTNRHTEHESTFSPVIDSLYQLHLNHKTRDDCILETQLHKDLLRKCNEGWFFHRK